MAKKPSITTVNSLPNNNITINRNFTNTTNAFDNTLSRDGSTPNNMLVDLDMDGNDLINVNRVEAQSIVVDGVELTDMMTQAVEQSFEWAERAQEYTETIEEAVLQSKGYAAEARVAADEAAVSAFGKLTKTSNLSDLSSVPTARANLGLVPVTSAADTTAGRILTVGYQGLGGFNSTPPSNNLNNSSVNSFIAVDSATQSGSPSLPFGGTAHGASGINTTFNGDYAAQMLFSRSEDRVAFRRRSAASTWQPWRELYHKANIVGTVTQASGVPTGAIIERGDNANGYYVKFADGTCFIQRNYTESRVASGTEASVVNIPMTVTTPWYANVSLNAQTATAGLVSWFSVANHSATTVDINATRSNAANSTFVINGHARWY